VADPATRLPGPVQPHQPAEQQHRRNGRAEAGHLLGGVDVAGHQILRDAEREPSREGDRNRPEPPEHRDGGRDEQQRGEGGRVQPERRRGQHSGQRCQHAAEHPCLRRDGIDGDAAQRGEVTAIDRGTHSQAEPGMPQHQPQRHRGEARDREDHDLVRIDRRPTPPHARQT
jgi:hypothetical protein